jgi:hypothetical protein
MKPGKESEQEGKKCLRKGVVFDCCTYEQASSCMRNTPKVRSRRAKSTCDMIGQPCDTPLVSLASSSRTTTQQYYCSPSFITLYVEFSSRLAILIYNGYEKVSRLLLLVSELLRSA